MYRGVTARNCCSSRCIAASCIGGRRGMVVHLEALPPELQTRIVGICDAAAAGAFARLSSACRLLVATHLAALLVAHRQVLSDAAALELQQAFATRAAPALLEVNDMGGGQLSVCDIQLRAEPRALLMRVLWPSGFVRHWLFQLAAASGIQDALDDAPPARPQPSFRQCCMACLCSALALTPH